MKRIIVICEGQTEREFCKDVLAPHFINLETYIQAPLIKKTGGGIVKWEILKKQIENHLKQEKDLIVTTFIDYYGLKSKHEFPKWDKAKKIININDRMSFLENTMKDDIEDSLSHRFIPYIQLHEFEGLLFNNIAVFTNNFEVEEIKDINELAKIIDDHPNPELINDGSTTAPSKRLIRLINGYNKIVYGSLLAEEIGLDNIREKCPRFNNWIDILE